MPVTASKKTGNVEINLFGYKNCDDVQLFWRTKVDGAEYGLIPGCLGFMIERQRKTDEGGWGRTEVLRNRVGFQDQENSIGAEEEKEAEYGGLTKSSSIWPFQKYEWTDHGANSGQTVRYRISAVGLPGGGSPGKSVLKPIADTGWTESIDVLADCGNGASVYFNRGFIMSQFVSRIARRNGWKAKDIKENIKKIEEPLRIFLSGELRIAVLNMLEEAEKNQEHSLYAALYELSDEELIGKLKLLKGRAHVILSNGSQANIDSNEESRKALKEAGVDVYDRMLAGKGLGHNKFAVLARTDDAAAIKAWTGSTNWAPTGLCTQVNNGIMLQDRGIAQVYLDQWQRLADAGSAFTKELVDENCKSPHAAGDTDIWFTRIRRSRSAKAGPDLQALIDIVNSARQAILYVLFMPGDQPLGSILKRAPEIYVHGVVSSVGKDLTEKFRLMGVDMDSKEYKTALVQPKGIRRGFSSWIDEVTRGEFLSPSGIGHAITHAKMIVIDPLSPDCKVITGSHNFSKSASEKNDENFVVIRGNRKLAEAYAVQCLATYDHYRWRAYVDETLEAGGEIWSHLSGDPGWQEDYLSPERKRHLDIWCR